MVLYWTAFRLCALAPLAALAAACALFNSAPAPIPVNQVLAPSAGDAALSGELRAAGADLRGYLSDE
jgi:hypothetical protein